MRFNALHLSMAHLQYSSIFHTSVMKLSTLPIALPRAVLVRNDRQHCVHLRCILILSPRSSQPWFNGISWWFHGDLMVILWVIPSGVIKHGWEIPCLNGGLTGSASSIALVDFPLPCLITGRVNEHDDKWKIEPKWNEMKPTQAWRNPL